MIENFEVIHARSKIGPHEYLGVEGPDTAMAEGTLDGLG